jgi:hypothetical protein
MDDEVIGDLAKEDLLKVGFVTGKAVKFLKAFASTLQAPTAEAAVETNAASKAKPDFEAKAPAKAEAASEAEPASDSGVDRHGSSNISLLKKDFEPFFAGEYVEEILDYLKPRHEAILKHLKLHYEKIQHTEEGDGSAQAATQPSKQMSKEPQLHSEQDDQPGKACFHFSRFDFKNFKVVPADDTRVDIRSDNGKHEAAVANAPAVLVRRGPVKLPARAIAKVSPAIFSSPLQAAANTNNAVV